MSFLTVSGVSKKNDSGFELRDISFSQTPFQKIALAGETGSGKSTVLKIIAGLIQPDSGAVFFEGERIKGPDEKLIPGHPGIAYLSQYFELRNSYRVEEELDYLNHLDENTAEEIFRICDIAHLYKRWTNQVSGGERQRIALARQLVSSPRLLLLDEPFSNLDYIHKTKLKAVIAEVSQSMKISSILVSHDPHEVLSWADEILVIKEGRLIASGAPQKLYSDPENEYVAGLLGKYAQIPYAWLKNSDHKDSENDFILRPEHLRLCPPEESDFKEPAIIGDIFFLGNGYEIEVVYFEKKITVFSERGNYSKGDLTGLIITSKAFL